MPRLLTLATTAVLLATVGCGQQAGDAGPSKAARDSGPSPEDRPTVLFDRAWVVEGGTWWIGRRNAPPQDPEGSFDGQANGLVGARDDGALWLMVPALYGKYRVRVELYDDEPAVPQPCEDVVEVSLAADGSPLMMGSFETFSKPLKVPEGDYRVRYCATEQDRAAAEGTEDELAGGGYRTYSGRHLLQLWPAPVAEDRVVEEGSDFAAEQNANQRGV